MVLDPLLDFVLVGAQKSASTYLQNCLAEHPQIDMPAGESRHFEDPLYDAGAVDELPTLFAPRRRDVRRGIKRPDYLARAAVPERVSRHVPGVRVLVVLRDPLPRAVSAYYDYVRLGFAPLRPLDQAFEEILSGEMQLRYPRVADVIDFGAYGRHLSRWLQHIERDRLLVLLQDRLLADPLGEVQRTYAFLDIDAAFVPTRLDQRSNTSVYSPLRLRLLRTRNRLRFTYAEDLSRREPRPAGAVGVAWSAAVTGLDRAVLARLDRTKRPQLSAGMAERVRELYADDAELLADILGKRVPWG